MEDTAIIELFFARSESAVDELSRKYGWSCRRLAYNLLGSPEDAEECVNDAWLGVWNTIPPRRPESLYGYVCRIVRNLAITRYHANTAKKRDSRHDEVLEELAYCLPSGSTVEDEVDARETGRLINVFLGKLDNRNRIIFMRRYWYGDSIEDIAAMIGVSAHYVSVRLSRIRGRLRKYLREEGVDA